MYVNAFDVNFLGEIIMVNGYVKIYFLERNYGFVTDLEYPGFKDRGFAYASEFPDGTHIAPGV
jgi:hypothetical protein